MEEEDKEMWVGARTGWRRDADGRAAACRAGAWFVCESGMQRGGDAQWKCECGVRGKGVVRAGLRAGVGVQGGVGVRDGVVVFEHDATSRDRRQRFAACDGAWGVREGRE